MHARALVLTIVALTGIAQFASGEDSKPAIDRDVQAFDAFAQHATTTYQEWLHANGMDHVITARSVSAVPPFLLHDSQQHFTLHLTLNGSGEYPQTLAHDFWNTIRDQLTATAQTDIEQRLLLRFAHQLSISATQATIKLTRYPNDQCWIVTATITENGYETHEHLCTSASATTIMHPEALAPLAETVKKTTSPTHRVATLTQTKQDTTICQPTTGTFDRSTRNGYCVTMSAVTPAAQIAPTLEKLAARLREHYKTAHYQQTSATGALREATIDHVKNEVLTDRWERLQLSLLAAPLDGKNLQVILIIDAQYAPGIGTTPPAPESYRDMEPQYTSALTTYTKALLTTLTGGTP
jgi:hypothetical protein